MHLYIYTYIHIYIEAYMIWGKEGMGGEGRTGAERDLEESVSQ